MESAMNALYWIGIMVVFIIAEAVTVNLIAVWFAAGSVAAALSAYLGCSVTAQVAVFAVVSAAALVIFKRFFRDKIKKNYHPTNADALIGKIAVVKEKVDPISSSGTVEIEGKLWSAKSAEPIEVGAEAEVLGIEGVKLVVKEKARVM